MDDERRGHQDDERQVRWNDGRRASVCISGILLGSIGWLAFAITLTLALALAFVAPQAHAQPAQDPTPLQFQSSAEEARFRKLVVELRCVMCQNQSLADSDAQIAHDLRREVLALMRQGKDDREIREFLVARYGDFVLYRPRVDGGTWLLWFGPALLVAVGIGVLVTVVRRRSRRVPAADDDAQEW